MRQGSSLKAHNFTYMNSTEVQAVVNSTGLSLDGVMLKPKKQRKRIKPLLYRSDSGITLEGIEERKKCNKTNVVNEPRVSNWSKKGGKSLFDTMKEMEKRGDLEHPLLKEGGIK